MPSSLDRLQYAVSGFLIDILNLVIPHVPIPVLYKGLDALFFLFSPLIMITPKVRKNVFFNLDIVFGNTLTRRQKRSIARRALRNLLNIPVISIYYAHPKNLPRLLSDITFAGIQHVTHALEQNKGVIGLGGHIGNFILMVIALAQTRLPFVAVTKEPRGGPLKIRYQRWKRACGLTWIDADSRNTATKEILRALKNNSIVHLISDERKKRDGIVVPFFGRPALTAPGPAVLSLRTGAPIIPIFITENSGYTYTIEFFPPIHAQRTGDRERDIYARTEKANEAIADFIYSHPDQWAWLNPRWRL